AEDAPLPPRYPLRETPSRKYAERTEWNVRDADGTLVLTRGEPTGGTALTVELAKQLGKPYLVVDLAEAADVASVREWAERPGVRGLNVAGPRQSTCPGIYDEAARFLRRLLSG